MEIKKYLWAIPFISAIFGIIALLTPVAYQYYGSDSLYVWYWALNVIPEIGEIWFNDSPLALIGGILETIVILFAVIVLLYTGLNVRKGLSSLKRMKVLWIICGILLLISPIGYIIGAVIYQSNFWEFYFVGFGIISSFIAAGLAILQIFVYRK